MFPEIEAADIVTEYGDHYIDEGQNMKSLKQALRQRSKTPLACTPKVETNTVYRSARTTMGRIVQAFQKSFTNKGSLTFKPRQIPLFNLKVDIDLHPDEVKKNWLGFLAGMEEADRMNWPIVRYMMEVEVAQQIEDDLETQCYYKGVFVEPTEDEAGLTKNSMDGLRKSAIDGLNANKIKDLSSVIGAGFDANNIFDKIEAIAEYIESIDPLLVEQPLMQILLPNKWVRAYLKDKRNTHGTDVNYRSDKVTLDFYDNIQIVGLPSMQGTNDVIVTPKANLAHITRLGRKPFKVESAKRLVSLMNDWWEAIDFEYWELVCAHVDEDASGSGS